MRSRSRRSKYGPLHLEVVDRDRLFALLPINLRDSERRPSASDYCVPEREPSGNDEPDALHHEGMFAGGGDGFDYLVSFRISKGERDDCRGGKDRRPENLLDFALAGLLVAG